MKFVKILSLSARLAFGGAFSRYVLSSPSEPETAGSDEGPELPSVSVMSPSSFSEAAVIGRSLFEENCSACHGVDRVGSENGPPFVHKIYEPGHHADISFQIAVQRGVRVHHWPFGDMPPQPDVSPLNVSSVVICVRELQRANGLN